MITARTAMSPLRPRNGCYEQCSRSSPLSQKEKSVLPEEIEHWPLMTLQGNWPGKLVNIAYRNTTSRTDATSRTANPMLTRRLVFSLRSMWRSLFPA